MNFIKSQPVSLLNILYDARGSTHKASLLCVMCDLRRSTSVIELLAEPATFFVEGHFT